MKYKFTITKGYVKNWGLIEGVREILQNAIDSEGKMEIDKGEDYISISNINVKLPIKSLLLGYGTKSNDNEKIGGHAEGSLLAIMALTRSGYNIDIINNDERWIPSFEYDDDIKENIFCITTEECEKTYKLTYTIGDINRLEMKTLEDTFLDLYTENVTLDTVKTKYGFIIKNPEMKGRMFVNGLPIYKDEDFNFGYDFKPEYVTLDRDRKSINRSELRKITTLALTYMEEPDYKILDTVIDKGGEDINYLENHIEDMNPEFITNYGEHLKERFGVDDNTVVSTKNELFETITNKYKDDPDIKLKTVDRAVYSKILNTVCDFSNNILKEEKKIKDTQNKYDEAWEEYNYSNYKDLLQWIQTIKNKINKNELDSFYNIIEELEPYNFYLIKDDVFKEVIE